MEPAFNTVMNEKQILLRLRIEYIAYFLLAVVLVVLYETNVFEKGSLAGKTTETYVLECVGIMLTVVFIPLALKSFHLALERMAEREEPIRRRLYVRWNEIRLAMFVVVVLLNVSIYYATGKDSCGYCAIIGAVASLFCWPPTKKGMRNELAAAENSAGEEESLADTQSAREDAKRAGKD